ncbi:MAG TPA: PilZ domain-containing protein [Longimicrobiaceae bacterium]|nr:PilZ domain-containing protein [Longimicrobiaceae bacterium]
MPHHFELMHPLSIRRADIGQAYWLVSLIIDFVEGKELVVGVPLDQGKEVRLEPGTRVDVEVPHPDGLRRYTAVVQSRSASAPPSLRLSWPGGMQRIQRRNAVRVPTTFHVDAGVPGETGAHPTRVRGLTNDLSSGGARISVPCEIPLRANLDIQLHLPDIGCRAVEARVVRRGETRLPQAEYPHWIAVEFTAVTESVRRDITNYVFDVQREQLRKGLG